MSGESGLAAGGHCSYGASDHRQNKNVRNARLEGQRQNRIRGRVPSELPANSYSVSRSLGAFSET